MNCAECDRPADRLYAVVKDGKRIYVCRACEHRIDMEQLREQRKESESHARS